MATLALPVNIIYTLGCGFVSLIVLFLNPVIVSVIYNDRQLRRQPSIIYIVNLALVDLCFAAVTFTTTLFRFLHLASLYPVCLLLHLYLPMSLITASLLLMFTNSVDRFVFIRMSLKYHSIMNSRVAKRVATGIWIYSAAFPLFALVICDHFWKYDKCADIVATQTYRLLHIPLQATFFITIVFTALMFVSVFRVVKNSRRLRHGPARSSSMDSLSTMVSSPTLNTSTPFLNTSTPSLPPIFELIPYDHSFDSAACPPEGPCGGSGSFAFPERPCGGSGSIAFPESHRGCVPATREAIPGNCLSTTDDAASAHINLPATGDGLGLRSCVSRAIDAMSLHVNLQTGNILPDLIVSQLSLEDLAENCRGDTDISATGAASDSKTADMGSDLRNKARFQASGTRGHISVARRLSVTSDLVAKSSDVLTETTNMGAELRDDICCVFTTTATVEGPDLECGVFGEGMKLTSDISVLAITREEVAAPDISASLSVALEQPDSGPNQQQDVPPSIRRNWRLPKSGRKHEHSVKGNQTDGKWQLGPKKNTFFKSRGYKVKFADSLYSYRVKMKSTIPREPLEMLKFKLDKWSSNETITNSDLHEDETCLSVSANTTPMSVRRSLASNHTHTNRLTVTHNVLQLSALPSMRHRRRSVSTSDNSSTVSMDSSSSYSHLTTESTVPSECSSSGPQKPTTTSHTPVDVPDPRATAAPRNVNSYVSDPGPGASRRRDSGLNLPQRSRLLTVRANIKLSTRRPPRLGRLSNASHNNTADSPRLPPRSSRRTFSRSISTLTTSSTSSIPFGASSYSGRDIRTVKILFIMFCVYIMLWLPAFVIQVLRYLDYDVSIEITLLVYTLGISNSVFNFFVYPMRIPKLRVSFQKLFKSAIADAKKNVHRCYCVIKGR